MNRPHVLRDTDFRRFFVGQFVSLLGDQASVLAIPLTAVQVLHAGPAQLGLLTAVGILPSLLLSLSAGAGIARRGRRRQTMLFADAVRAIRRSAEGLAGWPAPCRMPPWRPQMAPCEDGDAVHRRSSASQGLEGHGGAHHHWLAKSSFCSPCARAHPEAVGIRQVRSRRQGLAVIEGEVHCDPGRGVLKVARVVREDLVGQLAVRRHGHPDVVEQEVAGARRSAAGVLTAKAQPGRSSGTSRPHGGQLMTVPSMLVLREPPLRRAAQRLIAGQLRDRRMRSPQALPGHHEVERRRRAAPWPAQPANANRPWHNGGVRYAGSDRHTGR